MGVGLGGLDRNVYRHSKLKPPQSSCIPSGLYQVDGTCCVGAGYIIIS